MKTKTSLKRVLAAALLMVVASPFTATAANLLVSNANDAGAGSLRDALTQANSNNQTDTITFDPAFFDQPRTITLTSGELVVARDGGAQGGPDRLVTINGPGASLLTISGNNNSRIFVVDKGALELTGVTLRDGNGVGALSSGRGGAIFGDAASLTLRQCVLTQNGGPAGSAAVDTFTFRLMIEDSLFTNNLTGLSATAFSGETTYLIRNTVFTGNQNSARSGAAQRGGGAFVDGGTTTIEKCVFSNNSAPSGGGLYIARTNATITDTVFSANRSTGVGAGAVFFQGNTVARRISVTNNTLDESALTGGAGLHISNGGGSIIDSSITGNNITSSFASGAGINTLNDQPLKIINTTIADNSTAVVPVPGGTSGGHGAGIIAFGPGQVTLINCTIVKNRSLGASGTTNARTGGVVCESNCNNLAVQNTIIAQNAEKDVAGSFSSNGYNLIGNRGNSSGFGAPGDQIGVDPLLDPDGLRDNGGPTLTVALQPGSPAIDQGKSTEVTTDQRGFARPFDLPSVANAQGGDGSDIGALENGAASQPLNISTRLRVLTGENALIGGFILTGSQPKRVLIRAIGPSLNSQGVEGVLPDTTLELFAGDGTSLAFNDNWRDTQESAIAETTIPPTNDLESAILRTLEPGGYTAVVRGKDGAIGVGLIEAYDLARGVQSKLANISSRGLVDEGDSVIIGGFIVGGDNTRVVLRAIGPSLAAAGVANPLQDPTLQLVNGNGVLVQENDNWRSDQQAQIQATGIPPRDDRESALIAVLPRGNYTAIVRGKNNTKGVGLVEIYNVQ